MQREFALHFGGRAILELGELALVSGGRETSSTSNIPASALFRWVFEFLEAEVDRMSHSMVMSTVPVFASRSSTTVPVALLELAAPHRHAAEMIGFEAWMSVFGIYCCTWPGRRAAASGDSTRADDESELTKTLFMAGILCGAWPEGAGTLTQHATRMLRLFATSVSADAPRRSRSTVARSLP